MKIRFFVVAIIVHFGLSLAAYYGLNAVAVGSLDGGVALGSWAGLAGVVRNGLLQPVALWVLLALEVRWWTWPGVGVSAIVLLANSLAACALAVALGRCLRMWRSRS